jgi:hypothetical protein
LLLGLAWLGLLLLRGSTMKDDNLGDCQEQFIPGVA